MDELFTVWLGQSGGKPASLICSILGRQLHRQCSTKAQMMPSLAAKSIPQTTLSVISMAADTPRVSFSPAT